MSSLTSESVEAKTLTQQKASTGIIQIQEARVRAVGHDLHAATSVKPKREITFAASQFVLVYRPRTAEKPYTSHISLLQNNKPTNGE